jgi:hypothetical protein
MGIIIMCIITSCNDYSQINITNVKDTNFSHVVGNKFVISLNATIKNSTRRNIKVKSIILDVQQNKMSFAQLKLMEQVVLTAESELDYPIKLELELQNLLIAMLGFSKMSVEDFSIKGTITASVCIISRTLRIEEQPLKKFEAQFGNILSFILK